MRITIICRYYPTENIDKIVVGLQKIFPEAKFEVREEYIYGEAKTLHTFSELLKKQRIRDTARSVLYDGIKNNKTSFRLNKQVMTVGIVNFAVENMPLGDVEVTIEAEENEDIQSIIDIISPASKDAFESDKI